MNKEYLSLINQLDKAIFSGRLLEDIHLLKVLEKRIALWEFGIATFKRHKEKAYLELSKIASSDKEPPKPNHSITELKRELFEKGGIKRGYLSAIAGHSIYSSAYIGQIFNGKKPLTFEVEAAIKEYIGTL